MAERPGPPQDLVLKQEPQPNVPLKTDSYPFVDPYKDGGGDSSLPADRLAQPPRIELSKLSYADLSSLDPSLP